MSYVKYVEHSSRNMSNRHKWSYVDIPKFFMKFDSMKWVWQWKETYVDNIFIRGFLNGCMHILAVCMTTIGVRTNIIRKLLQESKESEH
jgi:hypothetical protein